MTRQIKTPWARLLKVDRVVANGATLEDLSCPLFYCQGHLLSPLLDDRITSGSGFSCAISLTEQMRSLLSG